MSHTINNNNFSQLFATPSVMCAIFYKSINLLITGYVVHYIRLCKDSYRLCAPVVTRSKQSVR